MTDKQDPIAHAARLLREAAEELRQSHTLSSDRNNWIGEPDAKAAYDDHLAAAQALEDWEAAVGAGGVSGPLMGIAADMSKEREALRTIGEEQAFEAWFKMDCPVEGANAKIAAKSAWKARASLSANAREPVAIRPDIQAVLAMLDVPVIARMSSHEGKLLKPGQEPPAFESAVPLVREWDHRRACESIIAALSRNN